MSKKNLSLWMDGFMGEAIPSDSVKEQPKEQAVEQTAVQTEQSAVQDDKQESPKAAPAKASSKQAANETETAATEQMNSKLEAKRRGMWVVPRKAKQAKVPRSPRKSEPPSSWIRI